MCYDKFSKSYRLEMPPIMQIHYVFHGRQLNF